MPARVGRIKKVGIGQYVYIPSHPIRTITEMDIIQFEEKAHPTPKLIVFHGSLSQLVS